MATIMIVEDDRQTNDAVAEYLKSFGYRMLSAYDGDEALQLFECNNIDLIILDIMIPKKTGLAVLHTIRAKSSVPILMLTAIGGRKLIVENECEPISAEHLKHIFEPFYRPDYARNQNDGGNGLGLYIVASILDSLKLSYSLEPIQKPLGMRFTITF